MPQALTGISVLDLTDGISGAYCTMVLGDMGADVVKVEKPGVGDSMRVYGPEVKGVHPAFTAYNRNKKSITLDLNDPADLLKLKQILPKFDVLVDNFMPGTMESLGLDHESLKEECPSLITLSITGFGSKGSYRDRPVYEGTIQAESGISFSIMDDSKGTPYLVGGNITTTIGAQYAVISILGALRARLADGRGRKVETNAYYAACSMMQFNILDYIYNHVLYPGHGAGSPCGFVRTKDGMVRVNSHIQVMWERTLQLIDDPVLHDPKFMDGSVREQHEPLILERMEKWLMQYTNKEIQEKFSKAGITIGIIRQFKDLANDPHLQDREQIVLIDVPEIGKLPYFAAPFRLSESKTTYQQAPFLGEHNAEYLPVGDDNEGGEHR